MPRPAPAAVAVPAAVSSVLPPWLGPRVPSAPRSIGRSPGISRVRAIVSSAPIAARIWCFTLTTLPMPISRVPAKVLGCIAPPRALRVPRLVRLLGGIPSVVIRFGAWFFCCGPPPRVALTAPPRVGLFGRHGPGPLAPLPVTAYRRNQLPPVADTKTRTRNAKLAETFPANTTNSCASTVGGA